jgi:hypothetical protein
LNLGIKKNKKRKRITIYTCAWADHSSSGPFSVSDTRPTSYASADRWAPWIRLYLRARTCPWCRCVLGPGCQSRLQQTRCPWWKSPAGLGAPRLESSTPSRDHKCRATTKLIPVLDLKTTKSNPTPPQHREGE